MDLREPVGWHDVWVVVKESALRRLGKPLVILHATLAAVGVLVVAISLLVMRFG